MSIKTRWEIYKEKNGVTPLDILNPNTKMVENIIHEKRMNICKSCPEFLSLTKQCSKCGCFMEIKTKMEQAICPLGKW